MTIRVLLADDNPLFREGMTGLLARLDDVEVVGQARGVAEAVRSTELLCPDVLLMDLSMPDGSTVLATREIAAALPDQPVCILTVSEEASDLLPAVRAGARGYLVKTADLDALETALHALADGGAVVSPRLARDILSAFSTPEAAFQPPPFGLTQRERDVLEMLRQGLSPAGVADRMALPQKTVMVQLRNVLDKLHLLDHPGDRPDMLPSGVPRRPLPGGLWAGVAASPEPDPDDQATA